MDHSKRAAEVLRRYVIAKALFRKVPPAETVFIGLEHDIRGGLRGFAFLGAKIVIDPAAPHVIVTEDQDAGFFDAIVKGDDHAIDMAPEKLAQWRDYVFNGGALPKP